MVYNHMFYARVGTGKPVHNGHIYAKIMHFRQKKHGRFWQFQGFPLIMHYLKVIKPTVQLKMPFKSDSNIQK